MKQSYDVQVAFLVDITGSMKRSIDAVHSLIENILFHTIHHFPGIQPEFGFVGYRDYDDDVPFVVIPFTKANRIREDFVPVIKSFQCEATGGGDTAEDVLGGMETALQGLDWTARVKLLIQIADAPHHGERFCLADRICDYYPEKENLPRPSYEILGDYADNKIDYYFFQVKDNRGLLLTSTMARIMEDEYNQCESRTKNFTVYELDKDFDMRIFFTRVMEAVSDSVLSMLSRDRTSGFARPICSKGRLEAKVGSTASILEDLRAVPVSGSILATYPVAETVKTSPNSTPRGERPQSLTAGTSSMSILLDDVKKAKRANRVAVPHSAVSRISSVSGTETAPPLVSSESNRSGRSSYSHAKTQR